MNKMWQPISLANTKLQRSMFLLEGDKTFLEAINIEQAKEKEREKLKTMFHSYYMDQVTSSFGDDLDKLREEEDFTNSKLQILIDSLQQGICIFSDSDKELILSTNGNQMESD
ncbi:hypothetical protein K502DRAFT_121551 [Neoconidiobolus thromboides FSU 785]|nr:hypothetical protein K502DRAFT_121551 [Neoconidiobolus thromboides FSU 785]